MMIGGTTLGRSPYDTVEFTEKTFTPLWTVKDFSDEKELLKWLVNAVEACEDFYRDFFQVCQDNTLLYRGIQWIQQDRYSNRWLDRQGILIRRSPRIVINHLYDFTEQWVSRATRYRPVVAIYPARASQEDADDAKTSKAVLDHIWYKNNIDRHLQEWFRTIKVCGEAYLWVTWDPTKGEIHPDWIAASQQGRVPVLDNTGKPITTGKGEQIFLDRAQHIGDVKYTVKPPWRCFEMPCRNREDIDWVISWDTKDQDYLRAKYPEKADDIKSDNGFQVFANYKLDVAKLRNQVVVYELYHRSTEFLEKGRYIKFTRDCVLENTDLPYSHGKLPYLHMNDIDIPDQIKGMSFMQQLYPLQHQINACSSLIYKSLVLFAHPKWIMMDGSVDINQLLNESTVVSYSGGVPPSLANHPPVSGELFNWINKLEELSEKLSGVFTMSRGEAPSGVRAAKALRVLEEQEDKRAYITMTKYNEIGLVENAQQTLSVAGDFYDDTDGRLIRIVGKDNEYRIKQFKAANLSKPYDIRIENTTALSQSSAGRIEDITELMQIQITPNSALTREQLINLLDLTADEQFKNVETKAYRCAQSENEDMQSGIPVTPPIPMEDLIIHWKTHRQIMQGREYKEIWPPERKKIFEEHFFATEYLMYKKAYGITDMLGKILVPGNPNFLMVLQANCPDFPVMFQVPSPMMYGMPIMQGMGMGLPPGGVPPSGLQPGPVEQGMPLDGGAPTAPPPMNKPASPVMA